MEEWGLSDHLNRALLTDDAQRIEHLSPFIHLVQRYINSKKTNRKFTGYRGGSVGMVPSQGVLRQPMFVSVSEDIRVAMQDLPSGRRTRSLCLSVSLSLCVYVRVSLFLSLSPSRVPHSESFIPILFLLSSFSAGAPVIEYIAEEGCTWCAPILENLSPYPDEREWIIPPYTPVQFVGERVDYNVNVRIVTVKLLNGAQYAHQVVLPTQVFLHPSPSILGVGGGGGGNFGGGNTIYGYPPPNVGWTATGGGNAGWNGGGRA
jgi:hypothetical protein